MCSCSSNYFGSSCQYYMYNECSTSPCINNGTCIVNINTVTVHQYTCTCKDGLVVSVIYQYVLAIHVVMEVHVLLVVLH